MSSTLKQKEIFNISSTEEIDDAKIINGNPNGIMNFNSKAHPWATHLFKKMLARTWFPEQVNITKDKIAYCRLPEAEKRCYDLVLSQLIMNDSIQTNQLMDKFNSYITSPIVNACICRQAGDEAIHSESYTYIAEEICQDVNRIYGMYKEDKELYNKNKAIEELYSSLYKDIDTNSNSVYAMSLACIGNIILEDLIFPCGFAIFFNMAHLMPGTAEMINEIAKDELLSHVTLFKHILTAIIGENTEEFNSFKKDIEDRVSVMLRNIRDVEVNWLKYVTKGVLGYSDTILINLVESRCNKICKYIGMEPIFNKVEISNNPLQQILNRSIKGGDVVSKENFFETNVTAYSKNTIQMDF